MPFFYPRFLLNKKVHVLSLDKYKRIVILTGAGISAESGIKTFRSEDGLWEEHRVEDVATPEGYSRDPEFVLNFYNLLRKNLQQEKIKPNAAHIALAKLEETFDGEFLLVTQNIDDLHERAGSKNMIHMHGELLKSRCPVSNKVFSTLDDLSIGDMCRCCPEPSQLRPHIVWFGEMPLQMDEIYDFISQADLFVSIGTSGLVYPAAGFVNEANRAGAKSIEINLDPTVKGNHFDTILNGKATEIVPEFFESLL